MRYITALVSALIASAVGFGAGYYYRAAQFPPSAQMEDYALTNLLEHVSYASYLAQGKHTNHRELLNVGIEGHLTKVRESQGANGGSEFHTTKVRTLNAIANLWAQEPPFTSAEWKQNETNEVWWTEWQVQRQKNLELLRWAQDECAKNPTINCRKPGGPR